MAFAIGSATSLDDFLSQLLAFAVTNAGFTAQTTVQSSAGSGSVNIRTVSKGGVYWTFHFSTAFLTAAGNTGIRAYMAYGNPTAAVNVGSSSLAPSALNATAQSRFTLMGNYTFVGPFANHWFFTDGTAVHSVIELSSGVYGHLSFGSVTKQGSWTGGEYLSANYGRYQSSVFTNWALGSGDDQNMPIFAGHFYGNITYNSDQYVRWANTGASADFLATNQNTFTIANIDSTSVHMGVSRGYSESASTASHPMAAILAYAPASSLWRSPMMPIPVFRGHPSTAGKVYVAGRIPRATFLRMTDDMPNASLIHTNWRVFPLFSRGIDTTSVIAPQSDNWAVAYQAA